MVPVQRDRLFLAFTWVFSPPSVLAILGYRALIAHQTATFNRLDNINFWGGPGLVLLYWFCFFTEGTASALALCLAIFRDATLFNEVHAWIVVSAGWFGLYYLRHALWPLS